MKSLLRVMGRWVVRFFGSSIRDHVDGECLGRALILSWSGRVYLIGYVGPPLRVVFVAPDKIEYWKCTIAFTKAMVPDFPREVVELSNEKGG